MKKWLSQYAFEPTRLNKIHWFRFMEEFGILISTFVLLGLICIGALIPTLNLDSIIVFWGALAMIISLLVATYGFLGLLIWRRHIRRLIDTKKK